MPSKFRRDDGNRREVNERIDIPRQAKKIVQKWVEVKKVTHTSDKTGDVHVEKKTEEKKERKAWPSTDQASRSTQSQRLGVAKHPKLQASQAQSLGATPTPRHPLTIQDPCLGARAKV
ncbi:hypothetical protein PIB30_092185 [Stylosanthes scabra]|uniref:Uncharacterized protein n=1 Tax=Stylosanthes scabra TaxID=79078 RepID=A0ABU6UTM2_9FABA|nr:hypothetical protein [Stylosanthes scabra]